MSDMRKSLQGYIADEFRKETRELFGVSVTIKKSIGRNCQDERRIRRRLYEVELLAVGLAKNESLLNKNDMERQEVRSIEENYRKAREAYYKAVEASLLALKDINPKIVTFEQAIDPEIGCADGYGYSEKPPRVKKGKASTDLVFSEDDDVEKVKEKSQASTVSQASTEAGEAEEVIPDANENEKDKEKEQDKEAERDRPVPAKEQGLAGSCLDGTPNPLSEDMTSNRSESFQKLSEHLAKIITPKNAKNSVNTRRKSPLSSNSSQPGKRSGGKRKPASPRGIRSPLRRTPGRSEEPSACNLPNFIPTPKQKVTKRLSFEEKVLLRKDAEAEQSADATSTSCPQTPLESAAAKNKGNEKEDKGHQKASERAGTSGSVSKKEEVKEGPAHFTRGSVLKRRQEQEQQEQQCPICKKLGHQENECLLKTLVTAAKIMDKSQLMQMARGQPTVQKRYRTRLPVTQGNLPSQEEVASNSLLSPSKMTQQQFMTYAEVVKSPKGQFEAIPNKKNHEETLGFKPSISSISTPREKSPKAQYKSNFAKTLAQDVTVNLDNQEQISLQWDNMTPRPETSSAVQNDFSSFSQINASIQQKLQMQKVLDEDMKRMQIMMEEQMRLMQQMWHQKLEERKELQASLDKSLSRHEESLRHRSKSRSSRRNDTLDTTNKTPAILPQLTPRPTPRLQKSGLPSVAKPNHDLSKSTRSEVQSLVGAGASTVRKPTCAEEEMEINVETIRGIPKAEGAPPIKKGKATAKTKGMESNMTDSRYQEMIDKAEGKENEKSPAKSASKHIRIGERLPIHSPCPEKDRKTLKAYANIGRKEKSSSILADYIQTGKNKSEVIPEESEFEVTYSKLLSGLDESTNLSKMERNKLIEEINRKVNEDTINTTVREDPKLLSLIIQHSDVVTADTSLGELLQPPPGQNEWFLKLQEDWKNMSVGEWLVTLKNQWQNRIIANGLEMDDNGDNYSEKGSSNTGSGSTSTRGSNSPQDTATTSTANSAEVKEQPGGQGNKPPLFCNFCKQRGHSEVDCPKRKTQDCSRCGGKHLEENCAMRLRCEECTSYTHTPNCSKNPKNKKCPNCNEKGHEFVDCPKRIRCSLCGSAQHSTSQCAPYCQSCRIRHRGECDSFECLDCGKIHSGDCQKEDLDSMQAKKDTEAQQKQTNSHKPKPSTSKGLDGNQPSGGQQTAPPGNPATAPPPAKEAKNSKSDDEGPACFNCNKKGHIKKDCPDMKPKCAKCGIRHNLDVTCDKVCKACGFLYHHEDECRRVVDKQDECFKCKKTANHKASNCTEEPRDRCFYCRKIGHKGRDCRRKKIPNPNEDRPNNVHKAKSIEERLREESVRDIGKRSFGKADFQKKEEETSERRRTQKSQDKEDSDNESVTTVTSPQPRKKGLLEGLEDYRLTKGGASSVSSKQESHVATSEASSRSGSVKLSDYPALYGKEFIRQPFKGAWTLPTKQQFEKNYDQHNVYHLLNHKGMMLIFDGTCTAYPGWRQQFIMNYHVQDVPVNFKCMAIDASMTDKLKANLFVDLTHSAADYYLRIKRLEERFGNEETQLEAILANLDCIKQLNDSPDSMEKAVFAIERYIKSAYCPDPYDANIARQVMKDMKRNIAETFYEHCEVYSLTADLISLKKFLNQKLTISRRAEIHKAMPKKKKKKKSKKNKRKGEQKIYVHEGKTSGSEQADSSTTESTSSSNDSSDDSITGNHGNIHVTSGKEEANIPCPYCKKGKHFLYECEIFGMQLNNIERWDFITSNKLCQLCLRPNHTAEKCENTKRKSCRRCSKPHNILIHTTDEGVAEYKKKKKDKKANLKGNIQAHQGQESKESLSCSVIKIKIPNTDTVISVNCLGDDCCNHCVLDMDFARSIGIRGPLRTYKVTGATGHESSHSAMATYLELLDPEEHVLTRVKVYCFKNPAGGLKMDDWSQLKTNWPHLKDLPLPKPEGNSEVKMIIGARVASLIAATQADIIGDLVDSPVARKTRLGWFVSGTKVPNQEEQGKTFFLKGAFQRIEPTFEEVTRIHMMRGIYEEVVMPENKTNCFSHQGGSKIETKIETKVQTKALAGTFTKEDENKAEMVTVEIDAAVDAKDETEKGGAVAEINSAVAAEVIEDCAVPEIGRDGKEEDDAGIGTHNAEALTLAHSGKEDNDNGRFDDSDVAITPGSEGSKKKKKKESNSGKTLEVARIVLNIIEDMYKRMKSWRISLKGKDEEAPGEKTVDLDSSGSDYHDGHGKIMDKEGIIVRALCYADKMKRVDQASKYRVHKIWDFESQREQEFLRNCTDVGQWKPSEKQAVQVYNDTYKKLEDGSIQVGLLWRGKSRPGDNTALGKKVFFPMERRMKKDGGRLWEKFDENDKDWEQEGFKRKLDENDSSPGNIIPFFMVVKENKATTKFRLIANAAFDFGEGSLNDLLLPGPNIMGNLLDILTRFRFHKYVITGDIRKMFLRIKVKPEDRKYLRYYWRDDEGKVRINECSSHIFGLTSSPFVVMYTVYNHAMAHKELYPLAAKVVQKDLMVDDYLAGAEDTETVAAMQEQLEDLFMGLNMPIHKIGTNNPVLRKMIAPEKLAEEVILEEKDKELLDREDEEMASLKCLGLLYHPGDDELQFLAHGEPDVQQWTKRILSSYASRCYDPMGLVCPCLLEIRMISQDMWRFDLDWDDLLPEGVIGQIKRWTRKFQEIHLIKIPRWVAPLKEGEIYLVMFSDSSSLAQGAMAYLVSSYKNEVIRRVWSCKQTLTSVSKPENIARLELVAAVMSVKLATQIARNLSMNIRRVRFYTDSTTCLWWMMSCKPLTVYVTNRVTQIKDRTQSPQWGYVESKKNPSDIITRGQIPKKLAKNKLYWEGPEFLAKKEEQWPGMEILGTLPPDFSVEEEEAKRERMRNWCMAQFGFEERPQEEENMEKALEIVYKHSNFLTGLVVATLVYCFIAGMAYGNKRSRSVGLISIPMSLQEGRAEAYETLKRALFRKLQDEDLKELKEILTKGGYIPQKYQHLRPCMDEEGIIRINMRLSGHPRLTYHLANPVLLEGKTKNTMRYIQSVHEDLEHMGGHEVLMNEVRKHVWTIDLTRQAKTALRRCPYCRNRKRLTEARRQEPPLHISRLPIPPKVCFGEIGADLFGHFYVKHGNSRASDKRWVLLIECRWTRAVSLQMVQTENTYSATLALERHCARYGTPRRIHMDNAGNFEGMSLDYQRQWKSIEDMMKKLELKWPLVEFNFIPSRSPRFGGSYEILVKSAKEAMKKVLKLHRTMTDEEMITLIEKTQAHLNGRPLNAPSSDPDDPRPLCPNDFLTTGSRYRDLLPITSGPDVTKYGKNMRKIMRQLWEEYEAEYVTRLQKGRKAIKGEEMSLKPGDFVYIISKQKEIEGVKKSFPGTCQSVNGRYRIGRIKKVLKSPRDGVDRVYHVDLGERGKDGETILRTMSYMSLIPVDFREGGLDEDVGEDSKSTPEGAEGSPRPGPSQSEDVLRAGNKLQVTFQSEDVLRSPDDAPAPAGDKLQVPPKERTGH